MVALAPPLSLPYLAATAAHTSVLEVPNGPAVNYLIGVRGATVSALEHATGCRIDVQKTKDMVPGSSVRTVTVTHQEVQRRQVCVALVRYKLADFEEALKLHLKAPQLLPPARYDPPPLESPAKRQRADGSADHSGAARPYLGHIVPPVLPPMGAGNGWGLPPGMPPPGMPPLGMSMAGMAGMAGPGMGPPGGMHLPPPGWNGPGPGFPPPGTALPGHLTHGVAVLPTTSDPHKVMLEIREGQAVSYLIGVKGSTVQQIEAKAGCRIDVQKSKDMLPGARTRFVTVSSPDPMRRRHAVDLICAKIAELHRINPEAVLE